MNDTGEPIQHRLCDQRSYYALTDVENEFVLWLESQIHSTATCSGTVAHFGERFHSITGAETGLSITGADGGDRGETKWR